jgi:hypothetical protein
VTQAALEAAIAVFDRNLAAISPRSSARTVSSMNGTRCLLTQKPVTSLATNGVLPILVRRSRVIRRVLSLIFGWRTTATAGIW